MRSALVERRALIRAQRPAHHPRRPIDRYKRWIKRTCQNRADLEAAQRRRVHALVRPHRGFTAVEMHQGVI